MGTQSNHCAFKKAKLEPAVMKKLAAHIHWQREKKKHEEDQADRERAAERMRLQDAARRRQLEEENSLQNVLKEIKKLKERKAFLEKEKQIAIEELRHHWNDQPQTPPISNNSHSHFKSKGMPLVDVSSREAAPIFGRNTQNSPVYGRPQPGQSRRNDSLAHPSAHKRARSRSPSPQLIKMYDVPPPPPNASPRYDQRLQGSSGMRNYPRSSQAGVSSSVDVSSNSRSVPNASYGGLAAVPQSTHYYPNAHLVAAAAAAAQQHAQQHPHMQQSQMKRNWHPSR